MATRSPVLNLTPTVLAWAIMRFFESKSMERMLRLVSPPDAWWWTSGAAAARSEVWSSTGARRPRSHLVIRLVGTSSKATLSVLIPPAVLRWETGPGLSLSTTVPANPTILLAGSPLTHVTFSQAILGMASCLRLTGLEAAIMSKETLLGSTPLAQPHWEMRARESVFALQPPTT